MANLYDQIPKDGYPKAPTADGSQNNPLNTEVGRNLSNLASAIPGAAGVPGAVAMGTGLAARALGASAPAVGVVGRAAQAAAPYAPVAAGAVALNSAAPTTTPATTLASAVPGAPPQAAPTPAQQPSGNSPVGMSVADAQKQGLVGERVGYNPAYDQRLTGAPGQNGAVTRNGNSYAGTNVSGDITVNGQAPGGGAVSAQNMVAADALQARQTPAGFQPAGSQPAGVQAPVVRNSTNDWAARNNLRNLEVSASSITNQPGFSRGGRGYVPPDVAAYQAALQADAALQQAQPGMDQTAMRENAGIQREGMQQDGATARTSMQEQGASARDAGRTALARDDFGLRKEAAGFQNRAAKRLEDLQASYQNAKTPEERAGIAQQLRELQGKEPSPQYKSYVMPAIRNADGSTTEGGVYQENTSTGEGRWVKPQGDGQAQQGALPKVATPQDLAALKSGTKFVDSNGVERIKK